MLLRPNEFFQMEDEHFWIMLRGWEKGIERNLYTARKIAELVVEGFVGGGKGVAYVRKAWNIEAQEQKKDNGLSPEQEAYLKKNREDNALKRVRKKRKHNARRT